jgi:hypothetical protein
VGVAVLSWRLAGTRATKHEVAHEDTEAVAGAAVAARAGAVWCGITEHTSEIAAKAPCGRPRPYIIYLLGGVLSARRALARRALCSCLLLLVASCCLLLVVAVVGCWLLLLLLVVVCCGPCGGVGVGGGGPTGTGARGSCHLSLVTPFHYLGTGNEK